jgi:hypothetical protein
VEATVKNDFSSFLEEEKIGVQQDVLPFSH